MVYYKPHQTDIYLPTNFTWQELAENLNRIDWKEIITAEEAAMQMQTVKVLEDPEAVHDVVCLEIDKREGGISDDSDSDWTVVTAKRRKKVRNYNFFKYFIPLIFPITSLLYHLYPGPAAVSDCYCQPFHVL